MAAAAAHGLQSQRTGMPNAVRISVKHQSKIARPLIRDYLVKRVLFDCCGFVASDLTGGVGLQQAHEVGSKLLLTT